MKKISPYGLPVSKATSFQTHSEEGTIKGWSSVSGRMDARDVTSNINIAAKLKRPLEQTVAEQHLMPRRKIIKTAEYDQPPIVLPSFKRADTVVCVEEIRESNTGKLCWLTQTVEINNSGYEVQLVYSHFSIKPYDSFQLPPDALLTYKSTKKSQEAFEWRAKSLSKNEEFGSISPEELWVLVSNYTPEVALKLRLRKEKFDRLSPEGKKFLIDILSKSRNFYLRTASRYNIYPAEKTTSVVSAPVTENKRVALNSMAAPHNDQKPEVKSEASGSYDQFKHLCEKRAEKLSQHPYFKKITSEQLWNLVSNYSPSKAFKKYIGEEIVDSFNWVEKKPVLDQLKATRYYTTQKTPCKKGSIVKKTTGRSEKTVVTPSTVSGGTTESSSKTESIKGEVLSSLSTGSQLSVSSETPEKKTAIVRVVLSNPHKNRCFINSVIHYFRFVQGITKIDRFTSIPDNSPLKENKVFPVLIQLLEILERYERGDASDNKEITDRINDLIIACLDDNDFKQCVYLKAKRKSRQAVKTAKGQCFQAEKNKAFETQLRQLEQEDAASFYMAVWILLRDQLPVINQVVPHQEMKTGHSTKTNKTNAESVPFIVLYFSEGNSIQNAIDQFFETTPPDNCISWAENDDITGDHLPPGKYPTSLTTRLSVHASLQRLSFRFELQYLQKTGQGKANSICKKVREDILVDIKVPVEDSDTGQRRIITATPCCIVAHYGKNQSSGHYVTLEKTPAGWLLYDDDKAASLQDSLASFLNGSKKFTPYLVTYDVFPVTTV